VQVLRVFMDFVQGDLTPMTGGFPRLLSRCKYTSGEGRKELGAGIDPPESRGK
jgi:hypothetical protein